VQSTRQCDLNIFALLHPWENSEIVLLSMLALSSHVPFFLRGEPKRSTLLCYISHSCELNCTSKGFSCNFLDLTVSQSPQGLSCDIFDKRSQAEYAGIEMIKMPHVHSNISMTAKLGVNSQFYRFLRLCSCKKFFVFQMVSPIVFLKAKGYPLQVLLKRTRGLVLKEKFLFGISAFGIFRMILLQVM